MDTSKRLKSLDTLRGFDMMFITGLSGIITAICGLFPGGADCALARNMKHVPWDGLLHHDTIFPLFLFIAGISFPFSYAKQQSLGKSKGEIYRKIIIRGLVLAFLGLIYNGLLRFDFANVRIFSVLGRIGFAWMAAAIIYISCGKKTSAIVSAAILVGYWLLLRFVPAPDAPGADPFSYEGCLPGYIDRALFPNHILIKGEFDNEGILSLFPAIVTAMLGIFTGDYVRNCNHSGSRKSLYMLGAALVMLGIGLLWSLVFPINKNLWSSSFVLVVGAYSLAMFALFYYIIDVRGWNKWTTFFEVFGLNSITIYMIGRIGIIGPMKNFFLGGLVSILPGNLQALGDDVAWFLMAWLILYFFYRKKLFFKV